jgi:uncharacterized protein (DUF433 family)
MVILGRGVFSIPEAARLTRLRPARVREWFRGRASGTPPAPVFQSDYPVVAGEYAISFQDLIELFIGGRLREIGVPLPDIRKVYANLQNEFGAHPFSARQLSEGDITLFTRGLDDSERERTIKTLKDVDFFDRILRPFLESIEYDEATNRARRWRIAPKVVIDPTILFGKPLVEEVGIATSVLRASYYANEEDEEAVANWFGISENHVRAAVDFEDGLEV